jgi:hypothetical protein
MTFPLRTVRAVLCVLAGVLAMPTARLLLDDDTAGTTAQDPGKAAPQDPKPRPGAPDPMQVMRERARYFTTPGKEHEVLARFLGEWEADAAITMGGQRQPFGKGTMRFEWLMDGRWLKGEMRGSMQGTFSELLGRKDTHQVLLMGYDRFKQSYVVTQVQNLDTAMIRSEGDLTPKGDALITYGTLDEYLTGEHDKMVRYVWRFRSEDEIVQEVHDLPIGEVGTQVLEVVYTRKKD